MRSLALILVLLGAACEEPSREPAPPRAEAPEPTASAPPPSEPEPPPLTAGQQVELAAGTLHVGSLPGTPHRRPSVEADLVPTPIPAFSVDRLPYPNDPAEAPRQVTSRREAAALCEARGQRLCHELEWERACKGDGVSPYPTGDVFDAARCDTPSACPAPTGVLDLGVRAPEWTASDAGQALARLERTAVARGAGPDAPPHAHRCAARHAVAPEGTALAFRCCSGRAPELAYPDVGERRMFRDLGLDDARYRAALASVPELAAYAEGFRAYDHGDALRALARGNATEADMHWEIAPGPFAWSPSSGEEVWVLAGTDGTSSLIAALYPLPDGTFRHAASFVFADEVAPVALLRTSVSRAELLWSTCWSCDGEGGAIRFDETAQIIIVQQ